MSRGVDDNLISFTGDGDGNVWRNGLHLFAPGPGMREHHERDIVLPEGRTIADVLKFSGVQRLRVVVHGELPGGTEDCIDVNNDCREIDVHCLHGMRPAGQYAITIKGGSRGVRVDGAILAPARVVEVDLGNHSDQSPDRTTEVTLGLIPLYPGKVRWRRLNANTPTLIRPELFSRAFRLRGWFRDLFAWAYALGKRLGLPI